MYSDMLIASISSFQLALFVYDTKSLFVEERRSDTISNEEPELYLTLKIQESRAPRKL